MHLLRSNTPILFNCFELPLPPDLSLVNQLSSVISGFENVVIALAVCLSCERPGCPGFIPSLKGVTKVDGLSFFISAPRRWTLRAGVVKDLGPLAPVIASLFLAPVVAGVDARGCREPTVVNADRPEGWTAGLRGELATRLPISLCDNRGGLKGFGLFDFVNKSAGDEIMGLAVIEGREKPKGVGVDGELREFSTALNAGRRGEEGRFDAMAKAFSELPTLGAEGRLESESTSSQMSFILA